MASPELLQHPRPLLGITTDRIETEEAFYQTFITNPFCETIYNNETFDKLYEFQPELLRYMRNKHPKLNVFGAREFKRGMMRSFNLLPDEHTENSLTTKDTNNANSFLDRNWSNNGYISFATYVRELDVTDPLFNYWVQFEAQDDGTILKRSLPFVHGALIMTLPFYLRSRADGSL